MLNKEFEQLIKDNRNLIYTVVNKYNIEYLNEKDLFQECVTKLFEVIDGYDDTYELSTFIYNVSENHLRDLVIKENRNKRRNHMFVNDEKIILMNIKDYDFNDFIERDEYSKEERMVLLTAFEILQVFKRKEIINKYLEGYTQEEIGDMYGVSKVTISNVWNKYIDLVREDLENEL